MQDVTDWIVSGYGENSTLEKLELLSPEYEPYIIKFPRDFSEDRVNWEDVNEVIAAKVAQLLGFSAVNAEIAYRQGRRGCLMKHFRYEMNAENGETTASLLSAEFGENYEEIQRGTLKNEELIHKLFTLFKSFSLYSKLKDDFVNMNLYDILIGNQDRHAHNWQVLYVDGEPQFGPLYDNGASLGWQLPESVLISMLNTESKMNKFYKKSKVKMGLDNKESPRISAKTALNYLLANYSEPFLSFVERLEDFNYIEFEMYLEDFPLISPIRKEFLKKLILFRMNKIITCYKEGGK
jgi:hypothetical protein